MAWYQWTALTSLGFCLIACIAHLIRLVRLGKPVDHSRPAGKTGPAVGYALTGAMSPLRKESALLHLPTYTAGLFYHTGTFISLALFFFFITGLTPTGTVAMILAAILMITAASGAAIFIKRIARKELRSLSNPDDYISNLLVTLFQITTVLTLLILTSESPNRPTVQSPNRPIVQSAYYLIFSLLMLYLPIGKLRHTVYFFAARYHLGYFFGRRGVWPPAPANTDK